MKCLRSAWSARTPASKAAQKRRKLAVLTAISRAGRRACRQVLLLRLGAGMVCACLALAGCAESANPKPKRVLAYQTAPAAEDRKKPVPVATQSVTPLTAPTPPLVPTTPLV